MLSKVGCSIILLASASMAQDVLPGTLASYKSPGPEGTSSLGGTSSSASTSSSSSDDLQAITAKQRIQWIVRGTIGPESLAAGLFSAGWGTGLDRPKAYGPHWEGFGDRYGMRLSGIAASNTIEAGLGAIWGEDPRYVRDPGAPFMDRLGRAMKMTFMAKNREGGDMLAYSRFIAIPSSNFLSNTWRAEGDNSASQAGIRTGLGFVGRLGSNTFEEFWPDVHRKLFHRSHEDQ